MWLAPLFQHGPLLLQSRLHQALGTRIGPRPLPPQDAAQPTPEPTVDLFQRPLGLDQLEIRCPTP